MEQIHLEVCLECDFEAIGWTAVGRELRKLIGDEKTYERINGEQVRVYRIPPRTQQARNCAPLSSHTSPREREHEETLLRKRAPKCAGSKEDLMEKP